MRNASIASEAKNEMKSAYELAMERLQKASPSLSLNDEQKKELADVDSSYRAKIAEKELFLKERIRKLRGNSRKSNPCRSNWHRRSDGYRTSARQKRKSFARVLEKICRASAPL